MPGSGDWRARCSAGDPFKASAALHNETIDVISAFKRNQTGMKGGPAPFEKPEGLILIQNNSGADVARFGILGISGVGITPAANLANFQNYQVLTGVTPTTASHAGKFVICQEPIPKGRWGRAFVFGTCQVQVNMGSATDKWADVTNSDATQLTSGGTGAAQILYSPSGATGKQWCLVRLAGGTASGAAVKINAIGGFGAYTGTTWLSPTSDIPSSSNVTTGLLGTAGVSCIILNPAEAGLSTNLLGLGTVHNANLLHTNSDGTPVYQIDVLPLGKTGSPTTLSGSGVTARSGTWTRNTDNVPVTITRYRYNSDSSGFYQFAWDEQYDACGILISAGYETKTTIINCS